MKINYKNIEVKEIKDISDRSLVFDSDNKSFWIKGFFNEANPEKKVDSLFGTSGISGVSAGKFVFLDYTKWNLMIDFSSTIKDYQELENNMFVNICDDNIYLVKSMGSSKFERINIISGETTRRQITYSSMGDLLFTKFELYIHDEFGNKQPIIFS